MADWGWWLVHGENACAQERERAREQVGKRERKNEGGRKEKNRKWRRKGFFSRRMCVYQIM